MEFKKKDLADGVYPEYAQVHIPQHAFQLTDHTNIEADVNVSKSEDNSLLYLGSVSAEKPGIDYLLECLCFSTF